MRHRVELANAVFFSQYRGYDEGQMKKMSRTWMMDMSNAAHGVQKFRNCHRMIELEGCTNDNDAEWCGDAKQW